MLIVIVVTAATALAAFVAVYQKQVQAEQAYTNDRSLEDVRVLSVVPTLNASGQTIDSLNFTVVSLDVNPMTVTALRVDGQPLTQYKATALNSSTGRFGTTTVAAGGNLLIGPHDLIQIIVNDSQPSRQFSFYDTTFTLLPTSYIELSLFTTYDNEFTQTFVPPTAVALVSGLAVFAGNSYVTVPELDGSNSFQTGNGTLVSWTWSVGTNNSTCRDPTHYLGEVVVPEVSCNDTGYDFELTVQNSYGLIGTSEVRYYNP